MLSSATSLLTLAFDYIPHVSLSGLNKCVLMCADILELIYEWMNANDRRNNISGNPLASVSQ